MNNLNLNPMASKAQQPSSKVSMDGAGKKHPCGHKINEDNTAHIIQSGVINGSMSLVHSQATSNEFFYFIPSIDLSKTNFSNCRTDV